MIHASDLEKAIELRDKLDALRTFKTGTRDLDREFAVDIVLGGYTARLELRDVQEGVGYAIDRIEETLTALGVQSPAEAREETANG